MAEALKTVEFIIEASKLVKSYLIGGTTVRALDDVDLTIKKGEMIAVTGSSGSGKSTLMNILGCLDKVDQGEYHLVGQNVASMNEDELAHVRNRMIGFIFQNFNLLPRMSALENVALPLLYSAHAEPIQAAYAALDSVGLANRVEHESNQLSGGQRQRVAIARALVTNPAILLADEPTGNLDSQTSKEIMSLFQELNAQGRTILVVTHEIDIAAYCSRKIIMRDGKIISDQNTIS